jgi:chorismate mutase
MRHGFLSLLLCLPVVHACRPAVAPPAAAKAEAFDALLGLMRSRLDVMHDVARWKWARKAPIEDPEREAALLRDVAEQGVALGLDPTTTRAFFGAQVEAAKLVQRADFGRWDADRRGPEGEAPDLAGVLRPRIDRLNRDLLAALAEAKPRLLADGARIRLRNQADQILIGAGIDATVRAAAIAPFMAAGD